MRSLTSRLTSAFRFAADVMIDAWMTIRSRPKYLISLYDFTMQKPIKNLFDSLDDLFGQLIRARGKCEIGGEVCGTETLQCSHNYSREYKSIRWHEDNAMCLCDNHHRLWEKMTQPQRENEIKNKIGDERFSQLLMMKNMVKKWTEFDLKEMKIQLRNKLNQIQ